MIRHLEALKVAESFLTAPHVWGSEFWPRKCFFG
jgi:hypothetical protein